MQRQHCLQVTTASTTGHMRPPQPSPQATCGQQANQHNTSNRPPAATQQSHQPPMHMQVCQCCLWATCGHHSAVYQPSIHLQVCQHCLWATCGHYSAVYQPPTANQAIQHSLRATYGHSSSYQHVPRSSPATCSKTAQCVSHLRPHSTTQHRFGNTTATGVHAGLAALSTDHLRPPSSVYCMLPATVSHSAKLC